MLKTIHLRVLYLKYSYFTLSKVHLLRQRSVVMKIFGQTAGAVGCFPVLSSCAVFTQKGSHIGVCVQDVHMSLQKWMIRGKSDEVPVFAWNDLMPGSNRSWFSTAKIHAELGF